MYAIFILRIGGNIMQVTLAKRYKEQDVRGWIMSEKLDGWRAIWTGYEFVSRNGTEIVAPQWFLSSMPEGTALDGELHAGRGGFNFIQSALQRKVPQDVDWERVTFSAFDALNRQDCFKDRLEYVERIVKDSLVADYVAHKACRGRLHLLEYFLRLVWIGAEGVVIREPNAPYEQFRSPNMLKLKPRLYSGTGSCLTSAIGWLALKLKRGQLERFIPKPLL